MKSNRLTLVRQMPIDMLMLPRIVSHRPTAYSRQWKDWPVEVAVEEVEVLVTSLHWFMQEVSADLTISAKETKKSLE